MILSENSGKDIFVCGIVSNTADILELFDRVFLLQISPEEIRKRLAERTTEGAFGKSEDEVMDVLSWHKDFDRDMLARGAIPIFAERPLAEIITDILNKYKIY